MDSSTRNMNSPESKAFPENRDKSLSAHDSFGKNSNALPKLTTPLTDQAAALGHEAANKVSEGVRTAEQWVTRITDPRASSTGKAVETTRQYVVAHPWQSIGVAVAFGFLLSRSRR